MADLNRNGLIGTTIFHLIIAFLLIFFGFSYPDPPPEEEGILVNFGTDDTGYGSYEPAGDDTQAGEEISNEAIEETVQQTVEAQVVSQPVVENTPEVVQDYEESPVKENKPTPEQIKEQEIQKLKKLEEDRIAKEKKIAEERIRLQKIEDARIAEEKRKQAEAIQKMVERSFGNKGVGTGDGSQGVTEGSSNQGTITDQPGTENYGNGGGLGSGISFGLGDRKARGTITPNVDACNYSSTINIRVQIKVDKDGNVISAIVEKSTYQDDCIYEAILKAAESAKFTKSETFRQSGWIDFILEP